MRRLAVALLCALVAAVPAEAAPPRAYALLSNGDVVAVSGGKVVARRSIGAGPEIAMAVPLLARHGGLLYAVTPRRPGQSLVVLDTSLAVRRSVALPADVAFSALAVGPSGRAYVLGMRDGAPVLATEDAAPVTLKPANGRDWLPMGVAVSGDERRLAVSYHGVRTTGADFVALPSGAVSPCRLACMSGIHGAVAFSGSGYSLIGTTGSTDLVLYDAAAREARRLDTRLPRNHLMALALDPVTGALVTAISCDVSRSFGVLARGRARVFRGACGDGVAALRGYALFAAADPTLRGRVRAGLYLVDARSGRRVWFVRVASPLAVAL